MESGRKGSLLKWVVLGCGSVIALAVLVIVCLVVWILSQPDGGVKLGNEMDTYALQYLEDHKILDPGETLLAYYDVTMSMDGTEAAILTNERVIYHKDGRSTAVRLEDVRDVQHRHEKLMGDIFEIEDAAGTLMKIEIAPLNNGDTFKRALMNAWAAARKQPPDPAL